ncbi:hypothetical protein ATK30_3195 [Amycolatopsis echigonensis]|uniref:Uncharacterized protein n=1 Tax=Amycolatopsis echigonensis TaxID=2576905 RepID=A0A2N3WEW0_9PSEU|nr:hypothetical protein ATK30_3195 [Amycolatopsis niigatensis]
MKGPDGISRRGLFSLRVPLWGMFGATVTAVGPVVGRLSRVLAAVESGWRVCHSLGGPSGWLGLPGSGLSLGPGSGA